MADRGAPGDRVDALTAEAQRAIERVRAAGMKKNAAVIAAALESAQERAEKAEERLLHLIEGRDIEAYARDLAAAEERVRELETEIAWWTGE